MRSLRLHRLVHTVYCGCVVVQVRIIVPKGNLAADGAVGKKLPTGKGGRSTGAALLQRGPLLVTHQGSRW